MTDMLVIQLPPDLAGVFGASALLMEAVPLTGSAIFRGAWRSWRDEDGALYGRDEVYPDETQQTALEALFVAAMGSKATDDAGTIREADYQHSKTREYGRGVKHSENRAGRWSYRRSKGR